MQVKEVMNVPVIAVEATEPVRHALELMREHEIRHLPVVDGSRVVGMVSEGDVRGVARFLDLFGMDRSHYDVFLARPIKEVMKTRYTVAGDIEVALQEESLEMVVGRMLEHKLTALPVLSYENGPLVGIISYIDVLRSLQVILTHSQRD